MTIEPLVPQQARSRRTHERLLQAAVDCLVAEGHAKLTTSDVGRRAGVSQGALYKHFPSKHALLAATVEHLFATLVDDFGVGAVRILASGEKVRATVEALWGVFCSPALDAVFELFTASRTDVALAAALRPVVATHRQRYLALARALFPRAAALDPSFDDTVHMAMMVLQGMAVMQHVRPASEPPVRELALLEALLRRQLAPYEEDRCS